MSKRGSRIVVSGEQTWVKSDTSLQIKETCLVKSHCYSAGSIWQGSISLLLAQGAALSWPPMEMPAPCLRGGCIAGSPPKIKGTILPCRGVRYWMHAFWWSFPTFPYRACMKWIVNAMGFLQTPLSRKQQQFGKGGELLSGRLKHSPSYAQGLSWHSCELSAASLLQLEDSPPKPRVLLTSEPIRLWGAKFHSWPSI